MKINLKIKFFLLVFFVHWVMPGPRSANADDRRPYRSAPELQNCIFYRAKKSDVPVFQEPKTISAVIDRLSLGEEVCYVGEEAGFAILEWQKQSLIRGKELPKEEVRAFARLADLWEPAEKTGSSSGILDELKAWYYYRQGGGVPEDPFGAIKPWADSQKNCDADRSSDDGGGCSIK